VYTQDCSGHTFEPKLFPKTFSQSLADVLAESGKRSETSELQRRINILSPRKSTQ